MDTNDIDVIFCGLCYIVDFITFWDFRDLCELSLWGLFYSIVLVIVIAIDVLALTKNNIFELAVHVDKGFSLKIDAIVIKKDGIASLNVYID